MFQMWNNSDSKRIWVTGFIYFVYRHNLSTNAKKAMKSGNAVFITKQV